MDFGSYNGVTEKHCMGFQEKNRVWSDEGKVLSSNLQIS
jgi:hypothetical protein